MVQILTPFTIVVSLFALTYLLIVIRYNRKNYFIWAFIAIVILLKVLSPLEAIRAINWNVMGIYAGMLFMSEMIIYSKIPDVLAEKIVSSSKKVWVAMIGVCFLSGLLSTVIENVAVVLIVAPVALFVAKRLEINPAPLLIGIAVMSNLQGVATMIGDPPSLLLANYAGLNFTDFFFFHGKPSLFFEVQFAAIISVIVLYFMFKSFDHPSVKLNRRHVKSYLPGILLAAMVALLAAASLVNYNGGSAWWKFLDAYKLGIISLLFGLFAWVWYYFKEKEDFKAVLFRLDWGTGVFLIGVFILVGSLIKVGFMPFLAKNIASITGSSVFGAYFIIIFFSVSLSAFIDNVPFIAAMLPVVGHLADIMVVSPYLFYFGLVIGASVGGNVTPVGASANIVAMGILKKNGSEPSFWDFVKIGLPFTIITVFAATALVWVVFR